MKNNLTNKSKFLSLILRHKPEQYGIKLDKQGGWAKVDDVIKKCNFTLEELEEIVKVDNKQRYSFNEDKSKIRANQGHSINIDLKLKTITPPIFLYHGTIEKFINSIMENGLLKQNRQYVHLSKDIETAKQVALRRGKPIILKILARKMMFDGYKFFISNNGVYLTDNVPSEYLKIIL